MTMTLDEAILLHKGPHFSINEARDAMRLLVAELERLQTLLCEHDGRVELLAKQLAELAEILVTEHQEIRQ